MGVREKPTIRKLNAKELKKGAAAEYTCITFKPDLERFRMASLDADTCALLSRRAFDVAGCAGMCVTRSGCVARSPPPPIAVDRSSSACSTRLPRLSTVLSLTRLVCSGGRWISAAGRYGGSGIAVHLNGKRVPCKTFEQYIKLHDGISPPVAFEKVGDDRWEVGVGVSDGSFSQISFVNAICTSKGGQHVNAIADQVTRGGQAVSSRRAASNASRAVCDLTFEPTPQIPAPQLATKLAAVVKKKNKGTEVKPALIKAHLSVFVNALIENPAFDSQTKETLTTRASAFGSVPKLSDAFIKKVEKSELVERILSYAQFKQNEQLKKKGGTKARKLTGIAKLDDANSAGTAKAKDCTLILTEGDSAKALAVSGLGIVGRDLYGVFPLKACGQYRYRGTRADHRDND